MTAKDVTAFSKALEGIDRSKRRTEVFRDFCEMASLALKKQTAHPARADQIEADYMACVARYRDKNDVRKMRDLLEIAVAAIAPGGRDFLGEVAGEIGALDARLGQFFTPYDTSRLIAEMTLADAGAIIRERGFITMQEPAAGAGGMVIAAADAIERLGYDPASCLWIDAIELNRGTYHMLHIQTAYRGLAAKTIQGNSLSLEIFDSALTPNALPFRLLHGLPLTQRAGERVGAEPTEDAPAPVSAEDATTPPKTPIQLSLF